MKAQFLIMVSIPANDAGIELERIIEVDIPENGFSEILGHEYIDFHNIIVRTTHELLGNAGVTMGWKKVEKEA